MKKRDDFIARKAIAELHALRRYCAEAESIVLKRDMDLALQARDSAAEALESTFAQGRSALTHADGLSPAAIMGWSQAAARASTLLATAETEATTASERFQRQQPQLAQRQQLADSAQAQAMRARERYRQRLDDERCAFLGELHLHRDDTP